MLERRDDYASLYGDFRWAIPDRFNIGVAVADRWAAEDPGRTALLDYRADGAPARLSFLELSQRSNAFANALRARGIRRGDRVALLLPQGFETVIAHLAIYKLGAIALPLALLFGPEALEYRLQTAGARLVVTNAAGAAKLGRIAGRLPGFDGVVVAGDGSEEFAKMVADHSHDFEAEATGHDDPAMMIFTSGTTCPPKGALLPHRVLLGLLRSVEGIRQRFSIDLRSICSAGESLGAETYEWTREAFGVTPNEFYGQTECNLVLGSCAAIGASRAGTIGKVVPGHRVAIIDADGRLVGLGEVGQIAVARPDPVMFLGYWRSPEATAKKFVGDWMTTGDQGVADGDGYVRFFGRDDDVITSAGFRIGPGEIEDCLTGHPAVALAAAVGKPDTLRTEVVKAYVVLKDGVAGSPALAAEISQWVRERLSAHEYPREVEFVDSMPLTTSGKVIRRIFRDRAKREAAAVTGA
ncbi:MAG: AMP-binding protein [Hyphomicrobiales bacterium]|nr:AMP-binding protein [Hyphomicrobiales bacterium]